MGKGLQAGDLGNGLGRGGRDVASAPPQHVVVLQHTVGARRG
jgi:hypothetical protein